MIAYKVAGKGNNWVRGFITLDDAKAYADRLYRRTGVIVEIRAYKPRKA